MIIIVTVKLCCIEQGYASLLVSLRMILNTHKCQPTLAFKRFK